MIFNNNIFTTTVTDKHWNEIKNYSKVWEFPGGPVVRTTGA